MNINSLSSYFSETVLDSNGQSVSNINVGIKNLYDNIIVPSESADYKLVVIDDSTKYMPDAIAHRYLGNQNLWHFFLLTNGIADPFTEIKTGWAFAIIDPTDANLSTDTAKSDNNIAATSRIGSVITLN